MTPQEARNIIEEDIKRKMLGPGYAFDVIFCPDIAEEILPERPKDAYRTGMLVPPKETRNNNADDEEKNDETDDNDDTSQNLSLDPLENNNQDAEPDFDSDNDEKGREYSEPISDESEDRNADNQTVPRITSHIGLITCIAPGVENIDIEISYATYSRMDWTNEKSDVKVITGPFTPTMEEAINYFDNNERTQKSLEKAGLKSLKDSIVIDHDNKVIQISKSLEEPPKSSIVITDGKFAAEGEFIKILFAKHYKRKEHRKTFTVNIKDISDKPYYELEDKKVKLIITTFKAKDKTFLKVILQSVYNKTIIYQPRIEVLGCLETYTEPITSLRHDEENNINEFQYRDVVNYGKGINCAVEWDTEHGNESRRIYTTFTPTIDVEKYSNKIASEYNNENIEQACVLRNLSKWSKLSDDEILQCLDEFVNGYKTWHTKEQNDAGDIVGYVSEKAKILENQEQLLDRLRDNVNYLRENGEALDCFKIANTAMLIQMVVAKHPLFAKNWFAGDNENKIFNDLGYFSDAKYIDGSNMKTEPSYFPFQLAFLLMNVKSTFEIEDPNHNKSVDLIWFPTGGGKTEAYLALTALTIVHRRRRGQAKGVSVIMRYTLRLLTTQQFERASYLICALDFLRKKCNDYGLGDNQISIGLYVGQGVTPNKTDDLSKGRFRKFFKETTKGLTNNPFPVTYCPWCGCRLVSKDALNYGYNNKGLINCLNKNCSFNGIDGNYRLPIFYIDEIIYPNRPTLLFATVDKFAQLYSSTNSRNLLCPDGETDSPDLIIQDELHLLVGALGSIVGFYEPIVEKLCSKNGRKPKIIASTATTRNTRNLIKALFGRDTTVFPAQGLKYNDNYFSHTDKGAEKRRQIGLMPSVNVSSNMAEIRLTAIMHLSKVKVFKKYISDLGKNWMVTQDVMEAVKKSDNHLQDFLDDYWSLVLYFNSLKDLGRSRSRVSQEVFENIRSHQYLYSIPKSLRMLLAVTNGFDRSVIELTGRIDSSRIKETLGRAEAHVLIESYKGKNYTYTGEAVACSNRSDLVFATNMISVGIDISRWNLMIMVGQPRSSSEYIQSSSRVARSSYGLVVNLLNPKRIRELSLFENYTSYHSSYYKAVEPLSITPMTISTIKHPVLVNMAEIYRKKFIPDITDNEEQAYEMRKDLFDVRFDTTDLSDDLMRAVKEAFRKAEDGDTNDRAQSLREIAPDVYLHMKGVNYTNDNRGHRRK